MWIHNNCQLHEINTSFSLARSLSFWESKNNEFIYQKYSVIYTKLSNFLNTYFVVWINTTGSYLWFNTIYVYVLWIDMFRCCVFYFCLSILDRIVVLLLLFTRQWNFKARNIETHTYNTTLFHLICTDFVSISVKYIIFSFTRGRCFSLHTTYGS